MKTHRFEQFELYLNGKMSNEEKAFFEAELSSDSELSSTFEVYRTIEAEMKMREKHSANQVALLHSLQDLNDRYFMSDVEENNTETIRLSPINYLKILLMSAAAVAVFVLSFFIFYSSNKDVNTLAVNYFQENLQQLSQTMSSADDSLQLGIAAYNNKEYDKALSYFRNVYKTHPENSDAKKYTGLSYLAKRDYENALKEFEALAKTPNLYSNPGQFLKAITLLMRNEDGDRQSAKEILEQLANKNVEGSKESREWLKRF